MKIAMFTDAYWPRVNGVTVSVDTYSRALIRAGHEVIIICSFYPEPAEIKKITDTPITKSPVPKIIYVPSLPLAISNEDRVAQIHKIFWVTKQVEAFGPDIVHINSEFVIAEFGLYYAKCHKLPAVYTFHTLWEEYIEHYVPVLPGPMLKFFVRRWMKYIMKRVNSIIVPTPQVEEVARKYATRKHLADKDIFLLPTGIEPVFFNPTELEIADFRGIMEQMYPALRDKRILLFAGRITKEKNLSFLLEILPAIIKKHPEIVLLIIGNGTEKEELQKESERLGLEDHCVFTGYLERKDLALAYKISDIFLFPSLTETQGLVTIEAMYSGIPVVAIGSMGTIMVMGGDNGGFMVPNDRDQFIARIFDLLEDSGLYYRKTGEAKQHAQNWSIDGLVVKLLEVYQKTLSQYHRREYIA